MSLEFSSYIFWALLLIGLGVVWLIVSLALKLARAVIGLGCSLLFIAAVALILVNLF